MDREGFREGKGDWGESGRRENPTRKGEPDPHFQRTERDSERRVRVERGDCEDKGSGEMIRISGGEKGVLRLGSVSKGGEYGSKSPLTLQDIGGDGRLLVVRGGGVSLLFHSIHPLS